MNIRNWPRKHLWVLPAIGTVVVIAVIVIAGLIWSGAPAPVQPHETPQAYHITPSELEREKARDKADLAAYLVGKEPAYNCADGANRNVTNKKGLVFCPAYTASITLTGNKLSQKPQIVNAVDATGKPMITITAKHYSGTVNSSDTGNVDVYKEYWTFTVTYDSSVFPAGSNMRYTVEAFPDQAGRWFGPNGIGWHETRFMLDAASTVERELYGADASMLVAGNPLVEEKLGLRS